MIPMLATSAGSTFEENIATTQLRHIANFRFGSSSIFVAGVHQWIARCQE